LPWIASDRFALAGLKYKSNQTGKLIFKTKNDCFEIFFTELTTLTYNSQQISEIGDFTQQIVYWCMQKLEMLDADGID
jgi:hypothetical protein